MNKEKLEKAISKFIELFIFKGSGVEYDYGFRNSENDRIVLDLDIVVDFSKTLTSHPNYDANYTNKIYNASDEIDNMVPKNFGLTYENFYLLVGYTITNDGFIHRQMQELVEDINQKLPEYGYDDNEIWGNIYIPSEDSFYVSVEFGEDSADISKHHLNNIIDSLVYNTDKYPYIRELINDNDYELLNY